MDFPRGRSTRAGVSCLAENPRSDVSLTELLEAKGSSTAWRPDLGRARPCEENAPASPKGSATGLSPVSGRLEKGLSKLAPDVADARGDDGGAKVAERGRFAG